MTAEKAVQVGEMLIDDCNCNATLLKVVNESRRITKSLIACSHIASKGITTSCFKLHALS